AKGPWAVKVGLSASKETVTAIREEKAIPKSTAQNINVQIAMKRLITSSTPATVIKDALQRPSQRSNDTIMGLVRPIVQDVREHGDHAVLKYTHRFEKATSLKSPVIRAP